MCDRFEDQFPKIKEQILNLSLDEVKANYDLLEYDVKPFLRKANSKPSRWNPNRELSDDEEVSRLEEDVYSRSVRPDSTAHQIPDPVLSGRSRNHFEGNVGRIYAYNLLFEVTDDDLHKLFGSYGPLKRAAINYGRDGRSLGTAFIVFRNRVDAQTAFQQLNGQPFDGRKLSLHLLDVVGLPVEETHQSTLNGDNDLKVSNNESIDRKVSFKPLYYKDKKSTPIYGGSGVGLRKTPVKRTIPQNTAGPVCGSNSKVGRMGTPLTYTVTKARPLHRRLSKSCNVLSDEINKELLITTNRHMPSIRSTPNSPQPKNGFGCTPSRVPRTGGTPRKPPFRI